jgi:two-component system response regulator PilR (NtrC family)
VNTHSIKKALIVDDEPDLCQLAEITLSRMGLGTRTAHDVRTAKSLLASEQFDICLTDMNLPDGNGIELVEHIQNSHANLPVAVITAYGNMESAVRALKAGAFDFVSKPVDLHVLRKLVSAAIKLPGQDISDPSGHGEQQLLGNSKPMQTLRNKIAKLARSQAPVFIHGESGCGKELAARLIHEQGSRSDKSMIPVNCGAIPSELMESEFFGHKKGSFTGAGADKQGLFSAADGGTLFLDEVADLPLQMQVKLLRAIQEKAIRPVGEHQEQAIDVRILSASHKNLEDLVKQGKFREDLYYRINVIQLDIPSLKERAEDIPLLAEHLIARLAAKSSMDTVPRLTPEAIDALCHYDFPGNVRELENILERALALADSRVIDLEDLHLPRATAQAIQQADSGLATRAEFNSLAEQEKASILQALEQTRWNKTAAARLLGLTLRQLRYRLDKLGID